MNVRRGGGDEGVGGELELTLGGGGGGVGTEEELFTGGKEAILLSCQIHNVFLEIGKFLGASRIATGFA